MFGEKAFELIKELKRSVNTQLPSYNEDLVRQVLDEMRVLFEENQKEVAASVEGEQGLYSGVQLRHASLERNKRCLLAYIYNRMIRIKQYRWDVGSVLPQDVRLNLTEQELKWFGEYNKSLAKYMTSIADGVGIDLTQNMAPPKSLFIEVRCLVDYGEFETEDGTVVLLKKNSQELTRLISGVFPVAATANSVLVSAWTTTTTSTPAFRNGNYRLALLTNITMRTFDPSRNLGARAVIAIDLMEIIIDREL